MPAKGHTLTMSTKNKQVLLLTLAIAAIVALRVSPLGDLLTFEHVKQHRDSLFAAAQERYWLSVASFMALYTVATAFSLPAGLVLTLAGGFMFGPAAGTLYIVISATAGATLAFLTARYIAGNRIQIRYQDQLRTFNDELERNGSHYLLTLRLIPIFPFFLINFMAGLTKVSLRTFVWTTAIGIIPATAVFAFAGRQIGTIAAVSDILSGKMLLVFAALGLVALLPVILKRVTRKGTPTTTR